MRFIIQDLHDFGMRIHLMQKRKIDIYTSIVLAFANILNL